MAVEKGLKGQSEAGIQEQDCWLVDLISIGLAIKLHGRTMMKCHS
jgi:hypothetical protein